MVIKGDKMKEKEIDELFAKRKGKLIIKKPSQLQETHQKILEQNARELAEKRKQGKLAIQKRNAKQQKSFFARIFGRKR
jgi:L-arabinose isomerase